MRLVISWMKKERTKNGVRRVPTNVRSLTGEVNGQEFESSLERDLLLLAHWDYRVDWYQSQPLTIEYQDSEGNTREYTPDLLISYLNLNEGETFRKPLLCEVKYREDLFNDWKILKPKLKAARRYAKEHDWEFHIMTEKEIRTPYLENVQFLWSYRFADFHQHHYGVLMGILQQVEETTPRELVEQAYHSRTQRGEALWSVWCMVARKWILCDLNRPLNIKTPIWVEKK